VNGHARLRGHGRAFWQCWTGHHIQDRIEAKKRCLRAFGGCITARKPDRRTAEIQILIALMIRFSFFGKAGIVRVK